MYTLPKDVRDKAIHALRNTDIKQCTGTYYREDGRMCALGILGHACGLDPVNMHVGMLEDIGLPPQVCDEVSNLNDTQRLTFPEIADWLEEHTHE